MHTRIARSRFGRDQRGNNLLEFGLVLPILFALLSTVFDAGFYVYSFIAVQNAARAAAVRNSGGKESAVDQSSACSIALQQLRGLPSIAPLSNGTCSSSPLVVTSTLCDAGVACGHSASSADGTPSTLVTVSYTLPSLFSLPLAGPAAVSISSQMKLKDTE